MSERPKLTFLAEIAREELQKKGHCSYLDCIFWSPDSRDALNAVGTEVLRVLKPLGIHAAVKALAAQTNEISAHKGNSSWRCRRRTSRRPTRRSRAPQSADALRRARLRNREQWRDPCGALGTLAFGVGP